jgi:phosphate transport system substrate-binding protein
MLTASFSMFIRFAIIVFFLGSIGTAIAAEKVTLHGGGASFPAPLYIKWFKDYNRVHPDVQVNYNAFGSGAGVANLVAGRLDFAGSDIPMTDAQIAGVDKGVVQIPMTAGAVVLVYNLEGIQGLRLSREAYVGIFLGTVNNWRHPLIRQHNQGIELPDKEITVVARVDRSGTTHVLTRHLGAAKEEFAREVAVSQKPVWPQRIKTEGRLEKIAGNGGVAKLVKVLPGSIGYTEYSYAYFTNLAMAALQNKAGSFVFPTTHAFLETIAEAEPSIAISASPMPIDPASKGAYPIVSLTWLLCFETYQDPLKFQALRNVLDYCLNEGQKHIIQTGYLPLVEPLLSEARKKADSMRLQKE